MPKFSLSLEWPEDTLLWATLTQLTPENKVLYDAVFDQRKLNKLMSVSARTEIIELYKDKFGYKVEGTTSQENINKLLDILED